MLCGRHVPSNQNHDNHWPFPPNRITRQNLLTPSAVEQDGPALEPQPLPPPTIYPAMTAFQVHVRSSSSFPHSTIQTERMYLARRSPNVTRVYREIPEKNPIPLLKGGLKWGEIVFALTLTRDFNTTTTTTTTTETATDDDGFFFQEPPSNDYMKDLVAIKVMNKSLIDSYLVQSGGTQENPYQEISVMELVGDNIHVIRPIESLQNDTHLYIVLPYCDRDMFCQVHDQYPSHTTAPAFGLPESMARQYFIQILQCLQHLQSHGICHGDISLENIMIHNNRCILIDLGCSFRIHMNENRDRRRQVPPRGRFGKLQYMAPEILVANVNFDAYSIDLWSAGISLFHMVTGELLNAPMNWTHLCRDLLHCLTRLPKFRNRMFRTSLLDLLNGLLAPPNERLSLGIVMQHPWIVAPPTEY